MKLLFDNNVPVQLRRHLVGHEVHTAAKLGWQEFKNGDLLDAAQEAGFDVLVTGDKNLSYQQNLTGRKLALVVLPTIDWNQLKVNPAPVAAAVERATPGSFELVETKDIPLRRSNPSKPAL